jgi:hypothetical protein
MYLDALSFLEEEREAWRPFERLVELGDEELGRDAVAAEDADDAPADPMHGWSGRDLMVHLTAWQERILQVARELALGDASPTIERSAAEWDEQGAEAVNAGITAAGRALTSAEVRHRFASIPGEMRGYLTVVPESRWVKHPQRMEFIIESTIDHYEAHIEELAALLDRLEDGRATGAGEGPGG